LCAKIQGAIVFNWLVNETVHKGKRTKGDTGATGSQGIQGVWK
jgi:hypothetical protein